MGLRRSDHESPINQENIMNASMKYAAAPWLVAAVTGAAVAFAPIASAATHPTPVAEANTSAAALTDTDPATPYGTDPESPAIFGYHKWLGDDVDVPF
jgi:hypothetical protein